MPNVPSLPTKIRVRSYPAEDFFARRAVGDDRPVGHDDPQAEDILAHRAVADGIGARRAGGRHAAEGGVRARVDGEEEPGVLDRRIELLAGHAGLDGRGQIVLVHRQDPVHPGQVDGDTALDRHDVPFDRRPSAVGDDGDAMACAHPDHLSHLRAGRGEDHAVRGRGVVGGIVPAVPVPDGRLGAASLLYISCSGASIQLD